MNDSALVERLRARDPAAFQCLNERYLPSIWRFVFARVDGDAHLAEDIVSETMLALIRAVSDETASRIDHPGGWLRSVARHKVQDHYRAVARVRHLIEDVRHSTETEQPDGDPAKQQQAIERRDEIRRAMDQLSDRYRDALEWKYLDRISVREIAERWETTEKAVESILFRARRELRMRLLNSDVADEVPNGPNAASSSESSPSQCRSTDSPSKDTCSSNDTVN